MQSTVFEYSITRTMQLPRNGINFQIPCDMGFCIEGFFRNWGFRDFDRYLGGSFVKVRVSSSVEKSLVLVLSKF